MPELITPPVLSGKRLPGLSPLEERGADVIAASLLPPPDWPGLSVVLANAGRVLRNLASKESPVGELAREHLADFQAALAAWPTSTAAEAVALLVGRRTAFPAWAWFATTGSDVPDLIQELAAAELLLSILEQRPFRKGIAARLAELEAEARDPGQRHAACARAAKFSAKLLADVRELAPDVGRRSPVDRAVRARIIAHLHQQLNDPNSDDRKAFGSARELPLREAAEYATRLKHGVASGSVSCLIEVLAHCMGMSIDTVALVPFATFASSTWIARIDPQAGIGQVDLGQLLALPASKPRHEEATTVVPLHFPKFAADSLRTLVATCPEARSLGDLLGGSAPRARPRAGAGKGAAGSASSARFVRSRASVAIAAGADAASAALATLDLAKVGKVDMHYITINSEDIWGAQALQFAALRWGEPVPRNWGMRLAIGSQVTPKREVVMDVDELLVRRVEDTRPGCRYTRDSLERFHNAFTLLCCHRAQFFTAARRAHAFEFYADWLSASRDTAILVDKRVGPHLGAVPLPMPVRLALQIKYWGFHLQALVTRLKKLSVHDHQEAVARIESILQSRHVRMFFLLRQGKVQEVGSEDLLKVHTEIPLNADAWRHYVVNALRHRGVPFEMVSSQLRHYLQGNDSSEYSALVPQAQWIARLARELDALALDLGMNAIAGLRASRKGGESWP